MIGTGAPYALRVDAALDPSVSRGLWLVEWLLLVPHVLVREQRGTSGTDPGSVPSRSAVPTA